MQYLKKKNKVANIFNNYFVNITKTLNMSKWKPQKGFTLKFLNEILHKHSWHPNINENERKNIK